MRAFPWKLSLAKPGVFTGSGHLEGFLSQHRGLNQRQLLERRSLVKAIPGRLPSKPCWSRGAAGMLQAFPAARGFQERCWMSTILRGVLRA